MCTLEDDQIENEIMLEKLNFNLNKSVCKKCRTDPPKVVLRKKDAYCKSCFLQATLHKFKAALGKQRIIKANERVLVVHSGGHPSTALLHFLHSDSTPTAAKKIRIEPVILFVERQYDSSVGERRRILKDVDDEVKSFNFPLHFTSLAQHNSITQDFNTITLEEDNRAKLLSKVMKMQSNLTIREDVLKIYERQVIIDVAKQLKCKYVFTTELAADLASQLLTDVSLGRGTHIPLNIGICDSREPDVKIIRPLRLHEMKELAFYNTFNHLRPVVFTKVIGNQYASVQNLTKDFISNLQANYPSTVTTIIRTGDKLSSDDDGKRCNLCRAPIENRSETAVTSAESTQFSHWLSTQTPNYNVSSKERYALAIASFNQVDDVLFCFACSRIEKYLIKR